MVEYRFCADVECIACGVSYRLRGGEWLAVHLAEGAGVCPDCEYALIAFCVVGVRTREEYRGFVNAH